MLACKNKYFPLVSLVGWLIGWLVGWFMVDWLVGWLGSHYLLASTHQLFTDSSEVQRFKIYIFFNKEDKKIK